MPVVPVDPDWELPGAVVRGRIGLRVGPFSEGGLNEALVLAVGFRRVRFGADVFEAKLPASVAEGEGPVATAVVGHDAGHGDAKAGVVGDDGFEKLDGAGG